MPSLPSSVRLVSAQEETAKDSSARSGTRSRNGAANGTSREEEGFPLDVLRQLVARARDGRLAQDDVFDLVPGASSSPACYGQVLAVLEARGIEVDDGDVVSDEDVERELSASEEEEAAIRKLDDPIRMYFSQMAK